MADPPGSIAVNYHNWGSTIKPHVGQLSGHERTRFHQMDCESVHEVAQWPRWLDTLSSRGKALMKIKRRTFIKGSAAVGGLLAVGGVMDRELLTLTPRDPEAVAVDTEEWVPTTCWIGKQDCGMLARKINGRVVKFEGMPGHPRNRGTLCPKGTAQISAVYDPNRVKTPLRRTNEKGVPGEFEPMSWNDALKLVAQRMNEVRERDPRLLIWQKGRSKAKSFYDTAFVKASGATKLHHGAFCSDAGYRGVEYTIGPHAVMHPDFRHTRYLLSWGWNVTGAGGNKTCWLTWNQQLLDAREKGLRMAHIDPRLRSAGPQLEDWLPIRPATDLVLALALCNRVIQQDTIDRDYLKKYTNSPHLVKDDGFFLRSGEKVQVWDTAAGRAVDSDTEGVDAALEGGFTVNGERVRPSFQVFKEHVSQYSAEQAAEICGLDASQIVKVARELGENAMIGSTTVVDGVTVPYRPVAIMTYHAVQQELGFQMVRAQSMLMMLLGAIGAVGGQQFDYTWKIHKNYEGLDNINITDTPNIYLNKSKFYPINSNNSSVVAQVMENPGQYGVDYVPEVAIVHMANPVASFASRREIEESYMKLKFVAVIDPWLSATADLFADVVLPAATIEKYEGPISATDQYIDATALRVPPMDPLFQSRGDIDIYLDLCEQAGILTGEGGYIDEVNKALKLSDEYKLPLDRKPVVRDIFDRWAKSDGVAEGVAFYEQKGIRVKGEVSPTKRYGYVTDPPFGGALHRLYGESLLRYRREMEGMGVDEIYYQDYTPLPTWRSPTMDSSPDEYDLYLISYKLIEFKQSRSSQIPLLAELAPEQRLDINPKTAKERFIDDGDEVNIESHNAVTGERRSITVKAHHTESIRPDTVGLPHHFGEVAVHPWTKGQGPTANELMFTGKGYVSNTADQSFHVKVRVSKA